MKISLLQLFRPKIMEKNYDREAEQCRKIALIEAYKQRELVRYNSNMCMRFYSCNIHDISMR